MHKNYTTYPSFRPIVSSLGTFNYNLAVFLGEFLIDLEDLFFFATSKTNFLFKGRVYDQIDGVAMGSPLAPILANLFMGHHEKVWLEMADGGPTFYRRYVDDIFLTFENEECALSFLDYLNNRHPNI